jgi:hypothetical protein
VTCARAIYVAAASNSENHARLGTGRDRCPLPARAGDGDQFAPRNLLLESQMKGYLVTALVAVVAVAVVMRVQAIRTPLFGI